LRERISVHKHVRQKFDLKRFDLKKLDEVDVKEKYKVEISNRFAALESLDMCFDINNAWESIRKNIKTSGKDDLYHRLKHNKPWFHDECSKLIDKWKQANYSGCKIQAKSTEIIFKIKDIKPVEYFGTRKRNI
jgi:hypothetical protein